MSTCSHDSEANCSVEIIDVQAVASAREQLPSDHQTVTAVGIFSALSDPTRLRICCALAAEDLCVCDLAAIAGVTSSAVSHQLRVLRDRGLVTFTRDGKRAVYRLADDHVRVLLAQGLEHAAEGGERGE